jgi:hypothetical protein
MIRTSTALTGIGNILNTLLGTEMPVDKQFTYIKDHLKGMQELADDTLIGGVEDGRKLAVLSIALRLIQMYPDDVAMFYNLMAIWRYFNMLGK